MSLKKIQRNLRKTFPNLLVTEDENSIFVSGELDKWEDVVKACQLCVDVKSGKHVVNDIKFLGAKIPEMRVPPIQDKSLDGQRPDVLIIGGGISGASIARELSKWNLDILLVDKEADLALHSSGRNDGEVHPGVDLNIGTKKQKYVLLGNAMYDTVCKELDVPFKRVGQYVGFVDKKLLPIVKLYVWQKSKICHVPETSIVSKDELRKHEPELNPKFEFAIYNKTAGCVCPYSLTIAYGENAVMNGAKISLNTCVLSMKTENGKILEVETNRGTIYPKLVINAAGTFAEDVAKMANDRFFSIHPRRGTNSILDKKANHLISSIASIKIIGGAKHTKGGGMLHTVHDNVLVGPNAVETYEKENFATDSKSIKEVFDKQRNTSPTLKEGDIITYFTGVRAPTFEEDFIIEFGKKTSNLIHCAGIQSPGLTTAPAVALDIEKMAVSYLEKLQKVEKNEAYNPIRHGVPVLREMPLEKRNEYIKKNPDYGVMICRCEEVSKGEIIDALKSPICVPTVDGIKKRLRPGMGRCQGGFCAPLVTEIIAEFLNEPISYVRKSGENACITFGETKGGEQNG